MSAWRVSFGQELVDSAPVSPAAFRAGPCRLHRFQSSERSYNTIAHVRYAWRCNTSQQMWQEGARPFCLWLTGRVIRRGRMVPGCEF
eukprot:3056678-Prymnesium_polylepis.1